MPPESVREGACPQISQCSVCPEAGVCQVYNMHPTMSIYRKCIETFERKRSYIFTESYV